MSVRTHIEPLTKRQREVLDLLVRGRTNYEIAQHLGISLDGAKWHVREVLARLDVDSREAAAEVWRRERSWTARAFGPLSSLAVGWKAAAAVAVAGVAVVAVAGAVYLGRGDDDTPAAPDPTVGPGTTPTPGAGPDEFAPRSGIAVIDELVIALLDKDTEAVKNLLLETPENCAPAASSPPLGLLVCPTPQPDGAEVPLSIDTIRGRYDGQPQRGSDLLATIDRVVPALQFMPAATHPLPDGFSSFFAPWRYEVYAYGAGWPGQVWALFLLDDRGIVGTVVSTSDAVVSKRITDVRPDDWIIAPSSGVHLTPEKQLLVIGRDSEIQFTARFLAPACVGKPFALRLYGYPDPGTAGGIQSIHEPGLATEARGIVGPMGDEVIAFRLPPSISQPMLVRPGLLSPCISAIAVQGDLELATLATPGDENVATFEFLGSLLDQPAGSAPTVAEFMGGELTATVGGHACQTRSLTDASLRNSRGNVVFRVGEADQAPACRAPGTPIEFVLTGKGDPNNPSALAAKPEYVPGTIRLIQNYGPEPPHREPRPPLIYE